MSVLPVGFGSAAGGGTPANAIERSLRFNSVDTPTLTRTPTTTGSRRIYTHSAWFKRTGLSSGFNTLWASEASGTNYASLGYLADKFYWNYYGGASNYVVETTQVFRDVSAWYHIVVAVDTTQATASNRVRIYVNGVQITVFSTSTYPVQDQDLPINTSSFVNKIGFSAGFGQYLNGYMTEVNFLDGYPTVGATTYNATTWAALNVSTLFGETDTNTGVWKPKEYEGTYGTNGFYVNFSDNSNTTAATLGKDYSGNGNNLTPSGFSVTAGVNNDSLVDTPTSYGTDTGVGGEVRGNYCTMNPLTVPTLPTINNGNLNVAATSGVRIAQGTFWFPSSGKWYYECTFNNASSGANGMFIGITSPTRGPNVTRSTAGAYFFYASSAGLLHSNGTDIVTGLSAISANEVFKLAVDIDNSKVWIGRGSTWYNSSGGTTGDPAAGTNPTFSISAIGLTPMSGFDASSVSLSMNFGQRSFNTTAPSGFKTLCTQNLPTPTIGATSTTQANDYFNTILYTGTGSSNARTGVGFQPDFVWIKERNAAADHGLYDAVRGVQKQLESNTTTAETTETTGLTAFGTDGFTVGALAQLNTSGDTYVAWNWKANGAGSSNTAGTITSTVSASTTSGFSIVTYTGTGANATVGHGLGAVPSMIIVKNRDQADAWQVYHSANTANPETDYLVLNTTAATADAADRWNDTLPTSTLFSIGNGVEVNTNTEKYVAYVFAPVAGYSAFGSYTGNGSTDGVFVYLGFRPRFIMIKRTDTTADWVIYDSARDTYNVNTLTLYPNLSNAEGVVNPANDFLSNGFKARNSTSTFNASGGTYIYAAFAESPFKYALAR